MTPQTIAIADITSRQLHHARLTKATKLAAILAAEYPAITLVAIVDEDRVTGWLATAIGEDGEPVILHEADVLPELADLLEAAEDAGIDPEAMQTADEDEEKTPSGSVVDETYRQRYREASSTGQSCGDWLAEQLANDTLSIDGFRPADFQAVLDFNAIDQTGAWAKLPTSGQKGWVGRWRMNGRQVLEKQIAKTGIYRTVTGATIEPEAGWLASTRAKHAKWLAKEEKLAALAQQLAA